ncbi:MAG: hypothetical protein ACI93P_000872 [bacterium]|jgi:hypothetical protein
MSVNMTVINEKYDARIIKIVYICRIKERVYLYKEFEIKHSVINFNNTEVIKEMVEIS